MPTVADGRSPARSERHALYEAHAFDPAGYSDALFAWARDFDGDGWTDVLAVGFPGKEAYWYRNPARRGQGAVGALLLP